MNSTTASQGIIGYIVENKGNRMPMKGIQQKTSNVFVGTVLFFEPTTINETNRHNISNLYEKIYSKLVDSAHTDSNGRFQIKLPVGKYSLFIRLGNQYFANQFDEFNRIALYEVVPNNYTEVKLTMNLSATF